MFLSSFERMIPYQERAVFFYQYSGSLHFFHKKRAWLIKVATNHCRDIQRFRFRHPRVPIEELAGTLVSQQEDREAIRELLHMPPKQRAVMVLHYVEGYQVKEIAGILGITEHAVKKRLQRGREQFRTIWKEEYCR